MFDKVLFICIFSGIWGFIGIVFFLIGLFLIKSLKKKQQICTSKTIGRVVDLCQERTVNSTSYSYSSTTYFHPVFEYTVNNLIYRKQFTYGRSQSNYAINQEVEIFYNPENPHNFYVPSEKMPGLLGKIFIIVGIIAILVSSSVGIAVYFMN